MTQKHSLISPEQMADMRSAFRIQQLQEKQRQAQAASPTVGKAEQEVSNPAPPLAMKWWEENTWFNAKGFEESQQLPDLSIIST